MSFIKMIGFITVVISTILQLFSTSHARAKPVEKSRDQSMIEFQFNFEKITVVLKLKIINSNSKALVSSSKNDSGLFLKISTPQFSAQQITEVPAVLLTNFRGVDTLKADMKALGFSESDLKGFGTPKEKRMGKGILYSWTTPTKGSANYYYLPNPENTQMAFKLGPFAGMVAKDFEIDWKNTQWKRSVSDQ